MKRKHFGISAQAKNTQRDQIEDNFFSDRKSTHEILENAWKNLPPDFTTDERFIFLEIAEEMIKFEYQTGSFIVDKDSSAN